MRNKLASIALMLLITVIGLELGGALYEGIVVASQWSAAPPVSLAILQGPFGLPLSNFWIPVHMTAQVLIVAVIILCWKDNRRRKLVLVVTGLYLLLRVPTFLYFIPELEAFTNTPAEGAFSQELKSRADLWVNLSTVRTLIIASVYVLCWTALGIFRQQKNHQAIAEGQQTAG